MNYKSHKGFRSRIWFPVFVAAVGLSSAIHAKAAETKLAWDANTEPDVAGYKVHYGSASRTYNQVLDVGKATQATVRNLSDSSTYYFAVTAYNGAGIESSPSNEVSTQQVDPANQAPVVTITSPADGSSFERGSSISVASSASDPDGTIAKVEFYARNTKIGEDQTAPYSVTWSPAQPGSYDLVAKATDNKGKSTSSVPVSVQITNSGNGGGGKKKATTFTTLLESSDPTKGYAGSVSLTATSGGKYSGKIKYDGKTYAVSGRLDSQGKATKQIKRKGKSPLVLTLGQGGADGSQLSGTITDGTNTADFAAGPAAGLGEQSTRNAGRWSVLLPPQESTAATSESPEGIGFATLVITKKGNVRVTGNLADGTPISQGARLSEDGSLPLYVPIYGKKGSFGGQLQLPKTDADPKVLTGTAAWHKPEGVKGTKRFVNGFQLALDVVGEPSPTAQKGTGAGDDGAAGMAQTLTLFGGSLQADITKQVTGAKPGKPQSLPGEEKLTLQLKKNGKFSGSFLDAATSKRVSFKGLSLPSQGLGAGFFLGKEDAGGVLLESAK